MARFIVTTTLCLALAASSQAFTGPQFQPLTRSYNSAISSEVVLQMNLFDRFARVAKSNLNELANKLEDPEKIMDQAIEEMQNDLVKIRQSYAEVTATQRRLLKQKEQCDAMAQDWYKRAQLALEKGNDELAKEALTRRQQQTDEANNLQSQLDSQADSLDKLYEGMKMLEKKISENKAKKDQMVARARTAQSTQKVNDMISGVTGKASTDAFARMEEKVEVLEAAAEVSAEMGSMTGNALPGSSSASIEDQFKSLEAASEIDDELAKMKGLLAGESSSSIGSSSSKKNDVDDELEKLKRDAGL
jgi:phage shock protein A